MNEANEADIGEWVGRKAVLCIPLVSPTVFSTRLDLSTLFIISTI